MAAFALHVLIQMVLIMRVLLRPHREPASRIAWVVVIMALPVLGILAYMLLGETNIGRRRVQRVHDVLSRMPDPADAPGAHAANLLADVPQRYAHLFEVGKTVNGFDPVGGNRANLMQDTNAAIESIVADIDAAKDHVHLLGQAIPPVQPGFPAQVIGTGPTVRCSAMPEMFESLMYTARRTLAISTPYYVPDESMQAGLCASARRGVDTTIVFPARNDSWVVGAASQS